MGSTDSRFKTLEFHEGFNLVLAEKHEDSAAGESRNGAGKTSVVRLFRYLVGGSRTSWIKKLDGCLDGSIWADLIGANGVQMHVSRDPSKSGASVNGVELTAKEWAGYAGNALLGFEPSRNQPTLGQVFSQLARLEFGNPVKGHPNDTDQICGARLGFYLGVSEDALSKAAKAAAYEKNRKALKKAIEEGAIGTLGPNRAEAKSKLVVAEREREDLAATLAEFKVDDNYIAHQSEADSLGLQLRGLNDACLALKERIRDLEKAVEEESSESISVSQKLRKLYAEAGLLLPDFVTKSFEDVAAFHQSVSRNRRLYLSEELSNAKALLAENEAMRGELDTQRSQVLKLLEKSMALDVFIEAQKDLTDLDASIAQLKMRIEDFDRLDDMTASRKAMEVEAMTSVSAALRERENALNDAISLFNELGREIYDDRTASLLVNVDEKGVLKVQARIDGDASNGINEVAIFLYDIVCVVSGLRSGAIPGILIHDSQLFDSMDDRQLASCLNIGARLASEYGFQYIVTLNTDRLEGAEREGFDRRDYALPCVMTDEGTTGGLFGFRFD